MNAEVAPSRAEQRLNTDPDGTQFTGILRAEGLHRAQAVSAGGERGPSAGNVAISVLSMGATSDRLEVQCCFARALKTKIPDRISCAGELARGSLQNQDGFGRRQRCQVVGTGRCLQGRNQQGCRQNAR